MMAGVSVLLTDRQLLSQILQVSVGRTGRASNIGHVLSFCEILSREVDVVSIYVSLYQ
jgi:hypothetical protein